MIYFVSRLVLNYVQLFVNTPIYAFLRESISVDHCQEVSASYRYYQHSGGVREIKEESFKHLFA